MRWIVAGSRSFTDQVTVDEIMEEAVRKWGLPHEVVSGGARGVDACGEVWARSFNLPIRQFLPDWGQGKSAGPARNRLMADYGTHLVAIWDGQSCGTANMIDEMQRRNKPVLLAEVLRG